MKKLFLVISICAILAALPFMTPAKSEAGSCRSFKAVRKVFAQEIAVAPLVVTVPVVTSAAVPVDAYDVDYYYSVRDAYREKAQIRSIIREELRAALRNNSNYVTTENNKEKPHVERPGYYARALRSFVTYCAKCHGTSDSRALRGDFRLLSNDGRGGYEILDLDDMTRWAVHGMVSAGAMPPAAERDASKAVPAEDLSAIALWAKYGNSK